ncbi:MAG TPA: hypothetical protein VMH81_31635 [Bryobacteraceae bacterium]|nr:hypothetical protein [Bryobacteraceae bacterium]
MPAHLHAAPGCNQKSGCPCSTTTCAHPACLKGGPLLDCQEMLDGRFYCFHRDYDGTDVLPDDFKPSASPKTETYEKWVARFTGRNPNTLMAARWNAIKLIHAFARRTNAPAMPKIRRRDVELGLRLRVESPGDICQGDRNLCAPAALLTSYCSADPVGYVKYVIGVYEYGYGFIGKIKVAPCSDFLQEAPPKSSGMIPPVDWIALGGLRNSENKLLDYRADSWFEGFRGGTSFEQLKDWFDRAGFTKVKAEEFKSPSIIEVARVNDLLEARYQVILSVSNNLVTENFASEGKQDHAVVLRSRIEVGNDAPNYSVKFTVSSGGQWNTPVPSSEGKGVLSFTAFRRNFFGYIAGKF